MQTVTILPGNRSQAGSRYSIHITNGVTKKTPGCSIGSDLVNDRLVFRIRMRGAPHIRYCAFALLLLACAEPDDRPISPGGGPVGPGGTGTPNGWAQGSICEVTSFTDQEGCRPLLNSGLQVSTFGGVADVDDEGTFNIEIKIPKNGTPAEHVPIYVVSTEDWFGGTIWTGGEHGEALSGIEVPLMTRATMEATVEASGAVHPFGDGIAVLRATGFNRVPIEDVDFGPIDGQMPYHGGPTAFSLGGTTSANGTAVYFGMSPGAAGFNFEFMDSGESYEGHSFLANDTFTIVPVQVAR